MKNARPLTEREQQLIQLYAHCELGMTPRQFYSKWQVNYEILALICSRSLPTVQRWFRRGHNYRPPLTLDLRNLALMDFLLEHFEQIPPNLLNKLCSSSQTQQDSQTTNSQS
ncbi:helix-turn-helix domain-containing protein [Nostoc sp. LEGE 12447]|uniref:helix-turn-helix domain-containing protein n=1 Tax=Nostoc sp. LEGE 12447 TaxID=1828640 RepID=UPI0018847BCE|nr:helix-turn-helix domain-containing protein [Nostoc sp. LEGE 12447]MBE9003087.1 helix-turn-helix domain-containing protein [Nostoc sp. LEGE 12447]